MQRKGAQKGKATVREADTPAAAKPQPPPGNTAVTPAASTAPVAKAAVKVHGPRVSLPRPEEHRAGAAGEEARRPGTQARKSAAPAVAPIIDARVTNEPEHRHFPRARLATRFELWREEGGRRTFAATFISQNVSVSGAFLESTFFMPMGTELNVRFSLEEGAEPVLARAQIVREERAGPEGRSGFGIRFMEFSGQTEVSLARLFLGMRLREFVEQYLQSRRARSLSNELERAVDVLAAWELLKATSPGDPWQGE
ncbi:MAG TPA: PilZ domain-containing protein [Myxococcaceae bacterium]|nr:PilZ domain-containing protein [Myxococcaceae bacterium]